MKNKAILLIAVACLLFIGGVVSAENNPYGNLTPEQIAALQERDRQGQGRVEEENNEGNEVNIELGENDEDVNSLKEAISANSQIGDRLGVQGRAVLLDMSRSIFNLVRYVVFSYIMIKAFSIFLGFHKAGDSPEAQERIKSKALWSVIALLVVVNFWSIYDFLVALLGRVQIL